MKVHINALSSDAEPEKSIRIRYEADLIATHHEFTHNKDTLEHVKAIEGARRIRKDKLQTANPALAKQDTALDAAVRNDASQVAIQKVAEPSVNEM